MKFIAKLNKRGQIGAPVELLVAVVIMALVIIISTQVLSSTNRQVCKSNVEKEIYEFKNMIEDTAKRSSANRFFFIPENPCFDPSKAVTSVSKLKTKESCVANCGLPTDSCWVLTFDSKESVGSIFVRSCLDIPAFTEFSTSCSELDGFLPMDALTKLPFGQYMVTPNLEPTTNSAVPEICSMYKKY